jgi:hypothetical protein
MVRVHQSAGGAWAHGRRKWAPHRLTLNLVAEISAQEPSGCGAHKQAQEPNKYLTTSHPLPRRPPPPSHSAHHTRCSARTRHAHMSRVASDQRTLPNINRAGHIAQARPSAWESPYSPPSPHLAFDLHQRRPSLYHGRTRQSPPRPSNCVQRSTSSHPQRHPPACCRS